MNSGVVRLNMCKPNGLPKAPNVESGIYIGYGFLGENVQTKQLCNNFASFSALAEAKVTMCLSGIFTKEKQMLKPQKSESNPCLFLHFKENKMSVFSASQSSTITGEDQICCSKVNRTSEKIKKIKNLFKWRLNSFRCNM